MPIPLILGGLAIAAAIAGVKKGHDAKGNFDDAKSIVRSTEQKYQEQKEKFEREENLLKACVEEYGQLKVKTYTELLRDKFMPVYQKFAKDIDLSALPPEQRLMVSDVKDMVANIDIAGKIASGTMQGLFQGAAGGAAAGAWALAGSVGVASTGTAIGTVEWGCCF